MLLERYQRSAKIADVRTTAENVCTTVQTIIKPTILLEPTVITMADSPGSSR